jgi:hypothetical protein
MVKPYLSRLRPAEPGPRLRPRPRSRFEPAPALPVDGPSIESLGLSVPSAEEAQASDLETELDQDPPSPTRPGPEFAAVTPGDRGLRSARTAPAERSAPHEVPLAASGRPPHREPGPADASHQQDPTASRRDAAPPPAEAPRREHVPAPWGAAGRPAPQPRPGQPDRAPGRSGRAGQDGWLTAAPAPPDATPAQRPPPAPHPSRAAPHRPGHATSAPADTPADRVQAVARWLRDADAAGTRPSPGAPGRAPNWPGPVPDTQVTVTIGRIEVKAPAVDAAPARPPSSAPRRRVPSLGDYLESRTRVKGRPE